MGHAVLSPPHPPTTCTPIPYRHGPKRPNSPKRAHPARRRCATPTPRLTAGRLFCCFRDRVGDCSSLSGREWGEEGVCMVLGISIITIMSPFLPPPIVYARLNLAQVVTRPTSFSTARIGAFGELRDKKRRAPCGCRFYAAAVSSRSLYSSRFQYWYLLVL